MLSCVIAVAQNGAIGRGNQLPWHLPADLKRFKAMTLGKPIIMGRKTYDSIGRPLPGRMNIVVSRQQREIDGCVVVGSLQKAMEVAGAVPEMVLIGGAELFRTALTQVSMIHLTRVHADVAGDVFFPTLSPLEWQETVLESHPADERHAYPFSFVTLKRRPTSADESQQAQR
jgi:dihydrofolate reductase